MSIVQHLLKNVVLGIKSFDGDGHSELLYLRAKEEIGQLLGPEAEVLFSGHMDATEGFFYFKDTETMEHCLKGILDIVKKQIEELSP